MCVYMTPESDTTWPTTFGKPSEALVNKRLLPYVWMVMQNT